MRHVVLASLLLLTACGGNDDSDSATNTEAAPTATETADTEPPATDAPSTAPAPAGTEPAPTEPATDAEPEETEPEEVALAPFEPIGDGPYEVGVETVTIADDERDRPLTVDVWFPLEPATSGEPHQYTFIPGTYYESPNAISASVDDLSADSPFPLVVYSHGSGGVRYNHSNYTEALASHGYIVAAADHTGNTAVDRIAGGDIDIAQVAYDRPADIVTVMDALTGKGSAETKGWRRHIDDESIAVTGHSFGGFTTLAVDSGFENGVGTVAADPRVDALIALAPAVGSGTSRSLLTDEDLARVDAPLLVMVGTNDQTTPADPNVDRIWKNVASDQLYRAELVDGQHQTFSDACAYLEFLPQLPEPNELVIEVVEGLAVEGCSPGDMPIDRAQDLTNTLAVTFLDSIFRNGEMITEENTEIPEDLEYQTR